MSRQVYHKVDHRCSDGPQKFHLIVGPSKLYIHIGLAIDVEALRSHAKGLTRDNKEQKLSE